MGVCFACSTSSKARKFDFYETYPETDPSLLSFYSIYIYILRSRCRSYLASLYFCFVRRASRVILLVFCCQVFKSCRLRNWYLPLDLVADQAGFRRRSFVELTASMAFWQLGFNRTWVECLEIMRRLGSAETHYAYHSVLSTGLLWEERAHNRRVSGKEAKWLAVSTWLNSLTSPLLCLVIIFGSLVCISLSTWSALLAGSTTLRSQGSSGTHERWGAQTGKWDTVGPWLNLYNSLSLSLSLSCSLSYEQLHSFMPLRHRDQRFERLCLTLFLLLPSGIECVKTMRYAAFCTSINKLHWHRPQIACLISKNTYLHHTKAATSLSRSLSVFCVPKHLPP